MVTCAVVGGDTPMTASWTFGGHNISLENSGILTIPLGDVGSILTISSVRFNHAGNYTCTFTNDAGSASQSAILMVNGNVAHLFSLNGTFFIPFPNLFNKCSFLPQQLSVCLLKN